MIRSAWIETRAASGSAAYDADSGFGVAVCVVVGCLDFASAFGLVFAALADFLAATGADCFCAASAWAAAAITRHNTTTPSLIPTSTRGPSHWNAAAA